jgi:hypothetical protein
MTHDVEAGQRQICSPFALCSKPLTWIQRGNAFATTPESHRHQKHAEFERRPLAHTCGTEGHAYRVTIYGGNCLGAAPSESLTRLQCFDFDVVRVRPKKSRERFQGADPEKRRCRNPSFTSHATFSGGMTGTTAFSLTMSLTYIKFQSIGSYF